jgi:hypothetical protein
MSVKTDLIAYLKASLTVEVYSSVVPEHADVPAVALSNVAFESDRVLSGDKTKRLSRWRVTAVAKPNDLQSLVDELESIDNTSNDVFRKVFVQLQIIEDKDPIDVHQRAFIDITVYNK